MANQHVSQPTVEYSIFGDLSLIGWDRILDVKFGILNDDSNLSKPSLNNSLSDFVISIKLGVGNFMCSRRLHKWTLGLIRDDSVVSSYERFMSLKMDDVNLPNLVSRTDKLYQKIFDLDRSIIRLSGSIYCVLLPEMGCLRAITETKSLKYSDISIKIENENFDVDLQGLTMIEKTCENLVIECAICADFWRDGDPPIIVCLGCEMHIHKKCWMNWAEGTPGALKKVFTSIQGKCPSCDQSIFI